VGYHIPPFLTKLTQHFRPPPPNTLPLTSVAGAAVIALVVVKLRRDWQLLVLVSTDCCMHWRRFCYYSYFLLFIWVRLAVVSVESK